MASRQGHKVVGNPAPSDSTTSSWEIVTHVAALDCWTPPPAEVLFEISPVPPLVDWVNVSKLSVIVPQTSAENCR
jgi:hypothetical protein